MKKLLGFLIFWAASSCIFAQNAQQIAPKIDSLRREIDSLLLLRPFIPKNAIFVEGLGGGGYVSVNYDRQLNQNWSIRAGVGHFYWYIYTGSLGMYYYAQTNGSCCETTSFIGILTTPIMINFMTSEGISPGHFEVGLGLTPWFGSNYRSMLVAVRDMNGRPYGTELKTLSNDFGINLFLPVNIGYRYQSLENGLFFRIGANALFGGNFGFLPWFGVSVGHSFE